MHSLMYHFIASSFSRKLHFFQRDLYLETKFELQSTNKFNSILEITIAAWFVDMLYVSGIRRWCEKLTKLFRRMQKKLHKFRS